MTRTAQPPEPSARKTPVFGIHAGDYAAWYLHTTGRWNVNCQTGTITDTRTGKPVRFSPDPGSYLRTRVRILGMSVSVCKHRAVWAVAHGILALPLQYDLEVDHINHDRTDCRIENLRLLTRAQNAASGSKTIPHDLVRHIRAAYAGGEVTQAELAKRHGIAPATVRRIVRRITYRSVDA
ncbi:HNH endonuclease signature motif containing protein [Methanocorpusculum vombati]|uniref:HNH endonuclease signature motif containing protein n=1 Tax=Methanocorpusculum vombati TaxID=3002864 RepID=A0ABT4ILK3_9EURY|nr:HNH endonuclease signature motif containing protein [Methanocorpusculum vombati]MCZ9319444.1 HNH endonuclease signature motif containing protein [Methanocorpusculum sp.]MCZ0862122.1 HNH endonuclease signature motif containing protein [Methanocorpusculum vombati]MDE2534797.1 HNH endonuclease signature motif containing protein [Methanocorpusculum sp.]HJK79232.1 HNH endonuclease signature motif containing protein [Methanocorpusculum sp.]HJK81152.1 HNH endonuclease signature motif containing pr